MMPTPTTKSKPDAIPPVLLADVSIRLGYIADQAFGSVITDIIEALCPHLRVGPASVRQCTIMRQGLVSHRNYPEILFRFLCRLV